MRGSTKLPALLLCLLCSPIIARRLGRCGPNHTTAKSVVFLPFLLFLGFHLCSAAPLAVRPVAGQPTRQRKPARPAARGAGQQPAERRTAGTDADGPAQGRATRRPPGPMGPLVKSSQYTVHTVKNQIVIEGSRR